MHLGRRARKLWGNKGSQNKTLPIRSPLLSCESRLGFQNTLHHENTLAYRALCGVLKHSMLTERPKQHENGCPLHVIYSSACKRVWAKGHITGQRYMLPSAWHFLRFYASVSLHGKHISGLQGTWTSLAGMPHAGPSHSASTTLIATSWSFSSSLHPPPKPTPFDRVLL